MVGVSEDDLGTYVLLEIPVIDTLDRTDSADGHEDRSPDLTVSRGENSCPGPASRIGCCPGESHSIKFDSQI